MKESHLFFTPQIENTALLPEEEAVHAVRVLRMKEGDEIWATDGKGHFFEGVMTLASSGKHPQCFVEIRHKSTWQQPWTSNIYIAVAPTKNIDRVEWFAEKATEIGINGIFFLDCANSERRVLKTERMEKIVVSATKQSHKATKPTVSELTKFRTFIQQPFEGEKFIAHCYAQSDISPDDNSDNATKALLYDIVSRETPTLVLIGPEGDFSVEEVKMAQAAGFRSISLGESRLRTETAALVAVQMMNLKKSHP